YCPTWFGCVNSRPASRKQANDVPCVDDAIWGPGSLLWQQYTRSLASLSRNVAAAHEVMDEIHLEMSRLAVDAPISKVVVQLARVKVNVVLAVREAYRRIEPSLEPTPNGEQHVQNDRDTPTAPLPAVAQRWHKDASDAVSHFRKARNDGVFLRAFDQAAGGRRRQAERPQARAVEDAGSRSRRYPALPAAAMGTAVEATEPSGVPTGTDDFFVHSFLQLCLVCCLSGWFSRKKATTPVTSSTAAGGSKRPEEQLQLALADEVSASDSLELSQLRDFASFRRNWLIVYFLV
ncbi:MAG: hypothetical protein BJ554DRAFT_76, partial [Olpidium bornovanus]